MDFLNPFRSRAALRALLLALRGAAPSLFLIGALLGCNRDFENPLLASTTAKPDTIAPTVTVGTTDTAKPVVVIPARPVAIESFTAPDMRLDAGQTVPAAVTVLPANATSPLYEMISNKPGIAEIRAEGVYGKSAGTATIAIRALDGSGKTGRFLATVDAIPILCVLSPCLCLQKNKGKDKCEED